MLIVTNREVSGSGASATFTRAFTPGQARLNLADAQVGSRGRWTLKQVTSDADDEQLGAALAPLFNASRPVLLYLHGNNNTPESCFERCGLLASLYDVEVVGFSWASEGSLSDGTDLPDAANDEAGNENDLAGVQRDNRRDDGLLQKARRYRQAKNNAQDSVDALARFLRLLSVARLQANAQPFSVAAHSLGSHFLQYTLEIDVAREALGAAYNIALVAPCVRASGHASWLARLRPRGRVFVTYNDGDSVLLGAAIADGINQVKLGADPGKDRVDNGVVRYVCFTRSEVGFGGHGYFVFDGLAKKTKKAFQRMFRSVPDIDTGEYPREIYLAGCDADGVTCYVGVPADPDAGG